MTTDPDSSHEKQRLRVLFVEDSVQDAKLCVRQLEKAGYVVSMDVVGSREDFDRALASKSYDVVLADYRLPNWSGLDALETLRRQSDLPFILVTGTLGEETAVECIKKGAADFVLKDRPQRLPIAVDRALKQRAGLEERERAEALLHLRTAALEAAANGIVITDRDGRIVWVNRAFSTLTGYSSEEVIGKNPRILKSGNQDPAFYRDLWQTILAGSVWRGEFMNRRKDGSLYAEEGSITPIRDQAGVITHFVDVKQDVTERKKFVQALRDSEARFHTLANAIPQLCWMANSDGERFWFNQRWYDYTGTTPEQMEGWGWQSVVDPNILPRVVERWKASIETGKPFQMTFPIRDANGLFRPFLTQVMPVRDENGKVTRWFGTNTDITEQRETEEGLRQASEQLKLALDAAELGAWDYRFETGDVFWDERCRNMFGFSEGGQVSYNEAMSRLHPNDRGPVEDALKQALAGVNGGAYNAEFRVIWPDGSVHWVACHGRVYFEGEGEDRRAVRFIGSNADITQRKQFEQVMHKNIQLENASLAKDRFLASMSHELRTPLNAILGFTGTLLMRLPGPLNAEQAKQLETIRSSARHLLALITDLLDLSKIESGKVALTIEPIVLQGVLEEVCATVRPLADKKGLELKAAAPPPELVVQTDRRAVRQILLNLASNAIKFTDEGEVCIVLERARAEGKRYVQFSVHDTGVGIAAEDQPKLYQYFTQVGREGRRHHESSGLGLYLSRKLAELLGGQINCHSEYGKGSTFTLALPEN